MLRVHRAYERYPGGDESAGIHTLHAFSFSGFYDPDNLGFGPLVACNEETLAPGSGFAEHPHQDLDIVTWVIEGELTHADSTGHSTTVHPGDVQRLTAGSGVRHEERNDGTDPLRFLQLWLVPGAFGVTPEYEVVRGIADGTPYALPHTDAVLHVRRLPRDGCARLPRAPWTYVHVVRGELELGHTSDRPGAGSGASEPVSLTAGDAARMTGGQGLVARAVDAAEFLIWEMHAEPSYG